MKPLVRSYTVLLPIAAVAFSLGLLFELTALNFYSFKVSAHGSDSISIETTTTSLVLQSNSFLSLAFTGAALLVEKPIIILNVPAHFVDALICYAIARQPSWSPSSIGPRRLALSDVSTFRAARLVLRRLWPGRISWAQASAATCSDSERGPSPGFRRTRRRLTIRPHPRGAPRAGYAASVYRRLGSLGRTFRRSLRSVVATEARETVRRSITVYCLTKTLTANASRSSLFHWPMPFCISCAHPVNIQTAHPSRFSRHHASHTKSPPSSAAILASLPLFHPIQSGEIRGHLFPQLHQKY
jgi:hypothetical protein